MFNVSRWPPSECSLHIGKTINFARSPNQKLLILPTETTAILGSLSGIAEIAKEAFGTDRSSSRTRGSVPTTSGPSRDGSEPRG